MAKELLIYLTLCPALLWTPFILKQGGKIQPKEIQSISPSDEQIQQNDSILFHENKRSLIEEGNWEELIDLYYYKGTELHGKAELELALEHYLIIDSISQERELKNPTTIKSIIKRAEITRTSFTAESSDYAYLLIQEALSQAQEINSQESIHITYVYLGDASGLVGKYEEAKRYMDLALEYFLANDKKEYEVYVARLYTIMISYFKLKKQYDKAAESLQKGIAYSRRKSNAKELANLLFYYGNFQGSYGESCEDALVSLYEAKAIFDSLDMKSSITYERLNRDIAECNYDFNNYKEAMVHYRNAYDLKVDLSRKANRELSRRLETQYQTQKKEQEIALLNCTK